MKSYDDTSRRYSYVSSLIDEIKLAGGKLIRGRICIRIPHHSGFCWGVDRALAMIADALEKSPTRRVWLLNQIIHNPIVNRDLKNRGVRFLRGPFADGPGSFDEIASEDLVVIPAFSAEVADMREIRERGLEMVDTTCPWVLKPHKRTRRYITEGFTTVIHGTVGHDETRATCSLIADQGGQFIVVHDLDEARELCAFIRGERGLENFEEAFGEDISPGFDAARHLDRLGMVNQTTMLASESRRLADMVREALIARHGEERLAERFRDFDSICRATQDNQDSFLEIVRKGKVDLLVVVGGFDSSNTKNLARIGDNAGIPAYHVENPDDITPGTILHRERRSGRIIQERDWLPAGEVEIAMTAGASTPDTHFALAVERVVLAAGEGVAARR